MNRKHIVLPRGGISTPPLLVSALKSNHIVGLYRQSKHVLVVSFYFLLEHIRKSRKISRQTEVEEEEPYKSQPQQTSTSQQIRAPLSSPPHPCQEIPTKKNHSKLRCGSRINIVFPFTPPRLVDSSVALHSLPPYIPFIHPFSFSFLLLLHLLVVLHNHPLNNKIHALHYSQCHL